MSSKKQAIEKRNEELRHKAEAQALEEADLDGADDIYVEPDRFSYVPDETEEPQKDIAPVERDELDTDIERTLI